MPMMAWNPDSAPQAMVIKTKGKTAPGMIGPPPLTNLVTGSMRKVGPDKEDAQGQRDDGADLEVGGEIIPGAEEQPDRQHRGEKAVDRG